LPRVTLPGFDYARKTDEKLEIPIQQRLAAMRAARGAGRGRGGGKAGPPKQGGKGAPPRSGGQGRAGGGGGGRSKIDAILDRHAPRGRGGR